MPGYTKLFSSIVASTVWNEDNDTRIVWITLLALADRRGIVEGSVPGLAVLARVSVDGCRAAITKLSNPDPDSRSQVKEGRRIEAVDGGWRIVNHEEYRRKLSEDDRREYQRHWMAEKRARTHGVDDVDSVSTAVDDVDISRVQKQSTEAATKDVRTPPPPQGGTVARQLRQASLQAFDRFWQVYPKRVGKGAAKKAWTKLMPNTALVEAICAAVQAQARSRQWLREEGRFIPNPATWLNQERWQDQPDPELAETF
jgi:hypothetical protein